MDEIEAGAMLQNNYHNFDSAMAYDDNARVLGYDSAMNYRGQGAIPMSQPAIGASTYAINLLYTNGGTNLPVEVDLFGTDFNTGTIVGDTYQYTNGTDTVTVSGRTGNFVAFMNRLRYAPFNIAWARLNPQDAAQFGQEITFRKDSVYGAFDGNTLLPEEYFSPEQFQALRVDVPMNFKVNSERRLIFNVGNTETGTGYNITFWINGRIDETAMLDGKSPVLDMTAQGLQPSRPSQPLSQVIQMQAPPISAIRPSSTPVIMAPPRSR